MTPSLDYNFTPEQLIKLQNTIYLDDIFLLAEDCLNLHEQVSKLTERINKFEQAFQILEGLGLRSNLQ